MYQVGSVMQFLGGAILRVAVAGFIIGAFFVSFGVLPWEFAARLIGEPPAWLLSGWLRLGVLIIGLLIIYVTGRFNLWSTKQQAIDDLSEDISWAINNLVNRNPRPSTTADIAAWEQDYTDWCAGVSRKLENRAFSLDQINYILTGLALSNQFRCQETNGSTGC